MWSANSLLRAPQLGSDQQQRDLARDSEEPQELDMVLALHWKGVQFTALWGNTLPVRRGDGLSFEGLSQLFTARRQKSQGSGWGPLTGPEK